MENLDLDQLEKLRLQYEYATYPRTPLETSPKSEPNLLFIHCLVTPYYLKYGEFIDTTGKTILDAGCGSGWKSLLLAEANPGAKIVGIDLSENSIKLAENRLKYWGFNNCEFYPIPLENLSQLELTFDYINCDETLYLLPYNNPGTGLKYLQSVLNERGIIRGNFHSFFQRINFYRGQELFKLMGLTENNPESFEIETVIEIMKALKDQVELKKVTWNNSFTEKSGEESILMNYFLLGDKGYTIPQMFAALEEAHLELISMVNWRQWELLDLFKEPDNLPAFLAIGLAEASIEEKLHMFELLHPVNNRLLDFWCGKPETITIIPISDWQDLQWNRAQVRLHPLLKNEVVKQKLIDSIARHQGFEISDFITLPTKVPIIIESTLAASLLPLWEGVKSFEFLVAHWLKIQPINPLTLEPKHESSASVEIKNLLTKLETFLYVLLTQS